MAETRKAAHDAFARFVETCQDKYPKAVEIMIKDCEQWLAFYDFPALHWQSLRTTDPIESRFATIRHRTKRLKGLSDPDHDAEHDVQAGPVCREQVEVVARI